MLEKLFFRFFSFKSRSLFLLMFFAVVLLNINFAILRSIRNTLTVVDIGGGAHSMPLFELFGALPGAFLMTWVLGRLLNKYSIQKVFIITLTFFLSFFLFFSMGLYPVFKEISPLFFYGVNVSKVILVAISLLFYVITELWKTALMIILFWGLVNKFVPLDEAKRLYGPLIFGSSLGTMASGPVISFCTSSWNWFPLCDQPWIHSLVTMMIVLTVFGITLGFLYYKAWSSFSSAHPKEKIQEKHSLRNNLALCWKTPQLFLLCWIVIADYIAYSLGEVVFFDVIRKKYQTPCDYCNFMGQLSSWGGLCTLAFAIFVNPLIMKHCKWVVGALVTPICLLVLQGIFFLVLRFQDMRVWVGRDQAEWLTVVIFFGSLQFCICRAAKYTLLDSSKELAFIMLPETIRMRGKLIVDGICGRLGRGSASVITLSLIALCGGVIASAPVAAFLALGMSMSWLTATVKLGNKIEALPLTTGDKKA